MCIRQLFTLIFITTLKISYAVFIVGTVTVSSGKKGGSSIISLYNWSNDIKGHNILLHFDRTYLYDKKGDSASTLFSECLILKVILLKIVEMVALL